MSKILHKNYYSENRKERGEKRFKEKNALFLCNKSNLIYVFYNLNSDCCSLKTV